MSTLDIRDRSLAARGWWHTAVALIMLGWLAAGIAIAVARWLGADLSWWLAVHSFTLGVVTTALFTYMTHFTEALTRTASTGYAGVAARVVLVQLGLAALIAGGAGNTWTPTADIGATLVLVATGSQIVVTVVRLRGSLAGTFAVTVPFYVVGAGFMVWAIGLAIGASHGAGSYNLVIAAHSRAMIWGLVLLAMEATVVTLLPTLTGTPISAAARSRCGRALTVHALALGAAEIALLLGQLALAGAALLLVAVAAAQLIVPVLSQLMGGRPRLSSAPLGVMAGLSWMLSLVVLDGLALATGFNPRAVTLLIAPALVGGGLVQTIVSVLQFLTPTLVGRGPAAVRAARERAQRTGAARLVLVNLGALTSLAAPDGDPRVLGLACMGLGLVWSFAAVARAVATQYRSA